MGNIYIARHAQLNRHVAIKLLRKELATRKEAVARFFQEADTINRLRHPNIIESIDLVEDVVDGAYCVLELCAAPISSGASPPASCRSRACSTSARRSPTRCPRCTRSASSIAISSPRT